MSTLIRICVAGVLAVGLLACSDDHRNRDNGGWDLGTHADTGPDADAQTGAQGYKVTFELKNESGRTIYANPWVEKLGPCAYGQEYWLSIQRDGEAVRPASDCTFCTCAELQADECVVCAVDCWRPDASRFPLASGESRQLVWDGRDWQTNEQNCVSPKVLEGETLNATICYGTELTDDEMGAHLTNPTCQTLAFALDQPEQTVRVVVPAPDPHPITIRMINDSGHELYAWPGEWSESGNPTGYGPWFRIGDGSSHYDLRPRCELCECSELEQDPGAICDEVCPDILSVEPWIADQIWPAGEARIGDWDGSISISDRVAGRSCNRQVVPPVDALVAQFCWSETLNRWDEFTGVLGELTCKDVDFGRTDDRVEWRVQ